MRLVAVYHLAFYSAAVEHATESVHATCAVTAALGYVSRGLNEFVLTSATHNVTC